MQRSRREVTGLLLGGVAGAALGGRLTPAWAGGPVPLGQPIGPAIDLKMHDAAAGKLTSRAVSDPSFWKGASLHAYSTETYDQVRLRELPEGYFSLVTGEGGQSFDHDVVVNTVLEWQDKLPPIEDGAMAIEVLGRGTDPHNGLYYVDTFFFLDFSLFYGLYTQRMYKLEAEGGRTFLFFEKVDMSWVGEAAWKQYAQRIAYHKQNVERRWAFNRMVDVSEIFGTFIVEPGIKHTSRVSFLVKLRFDSSAGAIAKLGTEMPPVVKAGLQSGFESCVKIAATMQG